MHLRLEGGMFAQDRVAADPLVAAPVGIFAPKKGRKFRPERSGGAGRIEIRPFLARFASPGANSFANRRSSSRCVDWCIFRQIRHKLKKLWPPEVGAPFRVFSSFFQEFRFFASWARSPGSRANSWGSGWVATCGAFALKIGGQHILAPRKQGVRGGLWTKGAAAVVALSFFR